MVGSIRPALYDNADLFDLKENANQLFLSVVQSQHHFAWLLDYVIDGLSEHQTNHRHYS